MRIDCPFCGPRPLEEFDYFGDASVRRPPADATLEEWLDYVYVRANPEGRHAEHWRHAGGCDAWLHVERDTVTHRIFMSRSAREVAEERS